MPAGAVYYGMQLSSGDGIASREQRYIPAARDQAFGDPTDRAEEATEEKLRMQRIERRLAFLGGQRDALPLGGFDLLQRAELGE